MSELPKQVLATDLAIHLIRVLREKHGPLMFHQSGGCCDGSSPMCYPRGEFMVGDSDIQLGEVDGEPFYMSRSQFEYWKHTQLTLGRCSRPRRHVFARRPRRAPLSHPLPRLRRRQRFDELREAGRI